MDYIFVLFLSVGAIRGVKKGGINILFSIMSMFLSGLIAYLLCKNGADLLNKTNFFGNVIPKFFEDKINNVCGKAFSSVDEITNYLGNLKFGGLITFFVKKLISNIDFSSKITLGECLSKPLSVFTEKILSFVIVFVVVKILMKILQKIVEKLFIILKISKLNRIFGVGIGLIQGTVCFLVFFLIINLIAEVSLNAQLISFTKTGAISNLLFNIQIEKAISVFI